MKAAQNEAEIIFLMKSSTKKVIFRELKK